MGRRAVLGVLPGIDAPREAEASPGDDARDRFGDAVCACRLSGL